MTRLLLALLLVAAPVRASAQQPDAAWFERLRAADMRLATIAHRLVTGNVALCAERQPATGMVLHAVDQYAPATRAAARAAFGFERPVAVELVVPGTAAAAAGVPANAAVTAVNGRAMPAPAGGAEPTGATRDAALAVLAEQPADAPLRLDLVQGGVARTVTVAASPGCRAAFELLLGPKMTAKADGRIVQIGVRFLERYGDEDVAVVIAHELAHIILRHRVRLEAAGAQWGFRSEFGRNRGLFRRTEEEADLLGLHLLRNAGYDPASAPRFWREHGGDIDHGLFRSRTHPSSGARARMLEAELARLPAGAPTPYLPPVLANRDVALR
ncbi:M48 family metallopeptidase [Sphingomonas lenta]|uniref:Peptidase M48 family protein n=1 Tax=Sphingomonas lenta TaxID=1141887 RepID=A0A2A2SJK8_9SPHN|nr:M48 family metallopeptidase [Sphingomonas lenta]PAX09211.1 peptidase M48 family protein [Sphingomonas lenta]